MDYVFAVPTSKFISYNTTQTLPWYLKKATFQKNARLRPLSEYAHKSDKQPEAREDVIVEDKAF